MKNVARSLNDAAVEQARLRSVTREIADYAASQLKGTIEAASVATRQLLEDVQASLHDAIAGDAILKSYSEETRQQFAGSNQNHHRIEPDASLGDLTEADG